METKIEMCLKEIEDDITRDIENGDFIQIENEFFVTKSGFKFYLSQTMGEIVVTVRLPNEKLVRRLTRELDEKQAAIYEEKARTLRQKYI